MKLNLTNKTYRPSRDEYYLDIADTVLERSTCLRRKYGAVIVNNDEIISTGYNGSPRGAKNCCDFGVCKREEQNIKHNSGDYSECNSVHAEQNALISAHRQEIIGATIYICGVEWKDESWVPIEEVNPCPICLRMIKNAGISRIVTRQGERNVCNDNSLF